MILHFILGALAVVSFLSTLWQWLVARRFPFYHRNAERRLGSKETPRTSNEPSRRSALLPAITLLKPLKGTDDFTESCLRSWLAQEYAGQIQVLFGVASADDPVCAVVKKLITEFPNRDAQLVVCPERLGPNAKVSKLAQLEPLVKHEVIIVSDADVQVPSDFLVNLVAPLTPSLSPSDGERVSVRTGEGNVGLVNCFYRFANPTTPAMHWEAIAVNADFWSQVLQGLSFRKLDFALGAVMATRRAHLAEIGGFRALVNCLADDYQLGNRIARQGHTIVICPAVVECWSSPLGWREVWRHQLRWARTIRVCQPLPYFFSIVSNATLWPLLWALTGTLPCALVGATVFLLARILIAGDLQHRLTPAHLRLSNFWLVPVKDLLQAALWVGAFGGNHIEWRGERYRLRRDGTLTKE